MATDLHAILQEIRGLLLNRETLVKAVAGGGQRGSTPKWRRVEFRPVELRSGNHLQITSYDDLQAHTRNETGEGAAAAVDSLIGQPFGHWHVVTTTAEVSFRVTKSGRVLVSRRQQPGEQRLTHDRVKTRVVDPSEPFLYALGITTSEGLVRPARSDKYHQVEEFVRALDAAVREASSAGRLGRRPLRVVDLGCGNAYLTFAAYRHLTQGLGLDVELVGVDVKAQAREHNAAVAARLGWDDHVRFAEGTISDAEVPTPVDIVLALHACDTATDDALARAVGWQACLVLAAPCCQHDLQKQLRRGVPAEPYGVITRHGLLRERFGDVLTDALRAHLMRSVGYRTDVIEFVDTQHTPRNVLLRAHRTGSPAPPHQVAEYQSLIRQWNVSPRLGQLLDQVKHGQEEGAESLA